MRHTNLLNYTLYQAGWLACILGAAWHQPDAGAAVALVLVALHLGLTREPALELRLVALALVVGLIVESWQVASGTYRFPGHGLHLGPVPAWLLLLWAQFATAFRYSLRGLLMRPFAAVTFGAAGGPLAFLAGARLGAVTLQPPLTMSLMRLSGAWLLALLVFSMAVRRLEPAGGAPRYRNVG